MSHEYGKVLNSLGAMAEVLEELKRSKELHQERFASLHEGYATLLEEVEELWDDIKDDKRPTTEQMNAVIHEAVQVAAMALKIIEYARSPDTLK